jgi:hypothetical protein
MIEGVKHKICWIQTLMTDKGIQDNTPHITLAENNQKYVSASYNCPY